MIRKDLEDIGINGQLGDWCFIENDTRIGIRFPNGSERGDLSFFPIANNPLPNGACWTWDGNRDAPTISPSINVVGVWHGWLKAGKLVDA